jgi:hypothetical protein
MRAKLLGTFFLAAVFLSFGCSKVKFDSSEVLWATNHESIFVETWHTTEGMIGQQIFLVYQQNENTTNKVALFTVLPEFQESNPGYPRFHMKDGEAFIQDAGTSYVFSVKSRTFITNAWPNDVYLGNYTNGPSIPSRP